MNKQERLDFVFSAEGATPGNSQAKELQHSSILLKDNLESDEPYVHPPKEK